MGLLAYWLSDISSFRAKELCMWVLNVTVSWKHWLHYACNSMVKSTGTALYLEKVNSRRSSSCVQAICSVLYSP